MHVKMHSHFLLQKKELASHLERLEQMQGSLKINGFKPSQRDNYEVVFLNS